MILAHCVTMWQFNNQIATNMILIENISNAFGNHWLNVFELYAYQVTSYIYAGKDWSLACDLIFCSIYLLLGVVLLAVLPIILLCIVVKCIIDLFHETHRGAIENDLPRSPVSQQIVGAQWNHGHSDRLPTYEEVTEADRVHDLPGYYNSPPQYTPSMNRSWNQRDLPEVSLGCEPRTNIANIHSTYRIYH